MIEDCGPSANAIARTARIDHHAEGAEALAVLDAATFVALYHRHLHDVYRYASARVRTPQEAEDITSEAFQRAWKSRGRYQGQAGFRPWLFGIVHRTIADHHRRSKPAARLSESVADNLLDGRPTPDEELAKRERVRRARAMLESLKPEQRDVLTLRFVAELSYAEIARVVHKREDAVKKIAYRAMEQLRRGANSDE